MDKVLLWFWFSCKRQLRRSVYLLLLMLLPFTLLWLSKAGQTENEGIAVALYTEEGGLGQMVADSLLKDSGMFRFYLCGSRQELEEDVASRRAECGYVFLHGLLEKLYRGTFRRTIEVLTAPSTVADKLSSEVVFSRLYEVYGRMLLKEYVTGDGLFKEQEREEAWQEIEDLYEQLYQDGSTFSFEYQTETSRRILADQSSRAVFPVRGMAAVYVFVTGLFSAVSLCTDEKNGLYAPVPYFLKRWCSLASMSAPVFLSSVSGLAAIWITGNFKGIRELLIMSGYVLAVVLVSYLLKCFIRNPAALCSLIPFFIIGSLVFCPVFFDLSTWIPALKTLGGAFLPQYYLMWF